METLTAEEIHDKTMHLNGRQNIAAINKLFRAQDESHLWPIGGRFNATEKAIRNARKYRGHGCDGLAYCLTLDNWISSIVNGEV